jgi:hypothetical protein
LALVRRLARRRTYDNPADPLGWIAGAEACRKIRRFDSRIRRPGILR